MGRIVVFSGTTEGRQLSRMLCEAEINHYVCVATTYGSDVMEESPYATVLTGRMDEDGIKDFLAGNGFKSGDIVVDATHPYAAKASKNIRRAASETGCALHSVSRKSAVPGTDSYVNQYDSMEDFARYIDKVPGNIMLTTGSRDIALYCDNVSEDTIRRTYVRLIPMEESIEACTGLGIERARIIAMQGPFSYELNKALFTQYDIAHMLTKDSGDAGGFSEKIRAAADLGISCHVLARPAQSDTPAGTDIYEIYEKITGSRYKRKRRIYLCGTGMGDIALMTCEVISAIRSADALFGAPSVLDKVCDGVIGKGTPVPDKYGFYKGEDIIKVLSDTVDITTAVILFSGDSGFFSGAKKCRELLAAWDDETEVIQLPGISAVSAMASRTGEAYDDAKIFSVHADNSLHNIEQLVHAIKHNAKTFALMSGVQDIRKIAGCLAASDLQVTAVVGRNLSCDDESISELTLDEAQKYDCEGKITALFINKAPVKRRIISSFSDDMFIRENVPMTKECIRHESIRRLGLREGDLMYDIGGGTGSVAIEAASLDPSIKVVTVEKDPKAAELIRRNIEKFGLANISVTEGDAADVLSSMEKPDCVFIGGSSGKMHDIVSLISEKGRDVRYVVNAVSLETMDEVRCVMEAENATDREAVQISVSSIETVGSHHMMKANNPVTVFSFTI